MSDNVVAIRATTERGTITAYTVSTSVMRAIRDEMYNWHMADLSMSTGVTSSCLYAIRRGKTVWPRPLTFFALIECFGWEIHIYNVKKGTYL